VLKKVRTNGGWKLSFLALELISDALRMLPGYFDLMGGMR